MAIQSVGPYVAPAATSGQPSSVGRVAKTNFADVFKDVEKRTDAEPAETSRAQLDRAVTEVKEALAPVARNLQFSIDDATGRSVVKVVDAATNEVIRQMPSEELLAITRSMDKFSGLFVKQKV